MFMIFGNHAINFDLVTQLKEFPVEEFLGLGRVKIYFVSGYSIVVEGVTIDQILTAQAAGQSRVQPKDDSYEREFRRSGEYFPITDDQQAKGGYELLARPPHFDDGSKRGQSAGNDKQAMNSIGRK